MLNLTAFAAKTRKNIWILNITQLRAKIISQVAEMNFKVGKYLRKHLGIP